MMAVFELLNTTMSLEVDVRDAVEMLRRRLAERLWIEPVRARKRARRWPAPHQFVSQ